jgi:hyaluronan synthase
MDSFQEGVGPQVVTKGRHTSLLRMLLNVIGCLISIPAYWAITVHCHYPVTLDLVFTILLTELNRLVNEGRRIQFYDEESPEPLLPPRDEKRSLSPPRDEGYSSYSSTPYDEKSMSFMESQIVPQSSLDSMAAVVGWREDPALFTRALESYKNAKHCTFMLVGIDGDDVADRDMVDVFNIVSVQAYMHICTSSVHICATCLLDI